MKKFLTCAIAAGAVLFATTSAFAAFTVKVGTTQPKIIKQGCERAGTITFTFPANSKLVVGDTYNIMLQDKVTLCKTIDYVIGDSADIGTYDAGVPNYTGVVFDDGKVDGKSTGQDGVVDILSADPGVGPGIVTASAAGTEEATPVKSNGNTAGNPTGNVTLAPNGSDPSTGLFYFHVYGKTGSTELTVKVLGTVANEVIQVGSAENNSLEIRLFNGKRYDNNADGDFIDAILLPTTAPTGSGITEKCYSPAITDEEPTVLNSLCIEVPATFPTSQNCVQVRYDAKDVIGNTPCDFSNDFDIACIDPNAYKLVPCAKGFLGEIPLVATTQNNAANCSFVYENPADSGYCSLPIYQGNRIVIESNKATFAPTSDKFLIGMESKTDGLYFSQMPGIYTFDVKDNACARNTLSDGVRTWKYEGDDTYAVGLESCEVVTPAKTYAVGEYASFVKDADCSVAASSRVRKITQIANAFSVTSTAQVMLVNPGTMVYDSTEYTLDKVEAKIEFTLYKKPCGIAGVFPVTLGTFVKSCTEVGSTLGLFFPYFPAMGEAWWSGLVITNGSETAGDATCVLYDEAGNSASFKTGSIPAGGQKIVLLDDTITLTPVKGTFDKTKKFSIKASTEFTNAAGLVVFGNGLDGQGVYKPYLGNEFSSVK